MHVYLTLIAITATLVSANGRDQMGSRPTLPAGETCVFGNRYLPVYCQVPAVCVQQGDDADVGVCTLMTMTIATTTATSTSVTTAPTATSATATSATGTSTNTVTPRANTVPTDTVDESEKSSADQRVVMNGILSATAAMAMAMFVV